MTTCKCCGIHYCTQSSIFVLGNSMCDTNRSSLSLYSDIEQHHTFRISHTSDTEHQMRNTLHLPRLFISIIDRWEAPFQAFFGNLGCFPFTGTGSASSIPASCLTSASLNANWSYPFGLFRSGLSGCWFWYAFQRTNAFTMLISIKWKKHFPILFHLSEHTVRSN